MISTDSQAQTGKVFKMGLGFWLFQAFYAGVLALSPLLCLFSAIPLSEISVIFGRAKGGITSIALLSVISVLALQFSYFKPLILLFILSAVMALTFSEAITRGYRNMNRLAIASGFAAVSLSFLIGYSIYTQVSELSLKQFVISEIENSAEFYQKQRDQFMVEGGEDSFYLADIMNDPEKMWQQVIHFPSYFFMVVMAVFWLNLYILLRRLNRLELLLNWPSRSPRAHQMINFKVPDAVIWLMLASLALLTFGYYQEHEPASFWAMNSLRVLGVFFFFQGFGVYTYLLYFLKIKGIFHFLLALITVVTLPQALALLGVLDFWFNFRQMMIRKRLHKE